MKEVPAWLKLLLGFLVAWPMVSAAQASDGICFALSHGGPALCPTEEVGPVTVFRPVGLPAQEIEPVEYESWLGEEKITVPFVYAWIDDYRPSIAIRPRLLRAFPRFVSLCRGLLTSAWWARPGMRTSIGTWSMKISPQPGAGG